MPIVGIAGKQQLIRQKLRTGEVKKTERISREIWGVAGLSPVSEQVRGCRSVAIQSGTRKRITHVDVRFVVLPPDFAECLVNPSRRVIAPTGFIEISAGHKIVEVAQHAAARCLDRAAAEGSARCLKFAAWIIVPALRLDRECAAQCV